MKKFLSKHIKKIVMFSFAYVYIVMILVTPTNYQVILPGGLTQLSTVLEIDGYTMDDHFYSVHVLSREPITIFQYYLLKNNDEVSITELTDRDKDTSLIDSIKQGSISKESSYQVSYIKAYTLARQVDEDISIEYDYKGLIIYDFPRRIDELDIGDLIIAIDGISLTALDFETSKELAYKREVTYTILDDGKTFDYHYVYDENDVYFWFFPSYEITDAYPNFDYEQLHLIGGSSGGLLQTLNIYVSLVNLNLKNVKIAGTGTIEMTGEVGLIGGIRQKIITANDNDVDVFFIPEAHLDDVSDMVINFELVPVKTLDEAVEWLYENIVE